MQDVEQAVLGGMMLSPDACANVRSILSAKDFETSQAQTIFAALTETQDAGDDIADPASIARHGKGLTLTEIVKLATTTLSLRATMEHTREIRRASRARQHRMLLLRAAEETKRHDYDPDAAAGSLIHELTQRTEAHDMVDLHDVMIEVARDMDKPHPRIHTGCASLDFAMSSLEPGTTCAISAKAGVGKTALAFQLLLQEAYAGNYGLAFSAEMGRLIIGYRMLAHVSGISRRRIVEGLKGDDFARISQGLETIAERAGHRIQIDDTPNIDVDQLVARAQVSDFRVRRLQRERQEDERGLSMVLVDYLQLLRTSGRDTREQEVAYMSGAIAAMAKRLNTRVLVISSLSKDGTVRDSGRIEYDVDMRIDLRRVDEIAEPEHYVAHVAKSRDGAVGDYHLRYIGERYLYTDWDAIEEVG